MRVIPTKTKWQLNIAKEVAAKTEELSKSTGLSKSVLVTLALSDMFRRDKWQILELNAAAE